MHRKRVLADLIDTSRFGGSRSALAEAAKRDKSRITQLLKEGEPFGWRAGRDLAADLGLPERYFELDAQVAPMPRQSGKKNDSHEIRQYDTGGKMGNGLVLRDQPGVIRSWTVSPDWLHQNVHRITSVTNLAIVTGFGDSMKPLFNPGDPLLIDTGRTRADVDGIYFFRVGEEGFIKRLQRIPTASNGMILRAKSENSKYDSFDIVKGMDFEVFGWVVKAWRGEDF